MLGTTNLAASSRLSRRSGRTRAPYPRRRLSRQAIESVDGKLHARAGILDRQKLRDEVWWKEQCPVFNLVKFRAFDCARHRVRVGPVTALEILARVAPDVIRVYLFILR